MESAFKDANKIAKFVFGDSNDIQLTVIQALLRDAEMVMTDDGHPDFPHRVLDDIRTATSVARGETWVEIIVHRR